MTIIIIIILNNVWQQQIVKDRESGRAAVREVVKSQIWLSDRTTWEFGSWCISIFVKIDSEPIL